MAIELLCRKIGMTRIFTETGECIPVTVLEAGPNAVLQKKTTETDGYTAVQLGFGDRRRKTVTKAQLGHFEKSGSAPKRWVFESRLTAEQLGQLEVGGQVKADVFKPGQRVDVIGTSKGRGIQGTVKRHHFKIKKATHGTHEGFRRPGSMGPGSYPGHVIKGKKIGGHMGSERATTRNVEVVQVDVDRNLILVRGGVPGHIAALVRLRPAVAAKPKHLKKA